MQKGLPSLIGDNRGRTMNKQRYSYVMMDADQFEWYQKHCKRNNLPCNYNQIGPDCYGVMIGEERKEDNVEYIERMEKSSKPK